MSNTQDVLIGFVIDRSSSMMSLTDATIEGFNSFINAQREAPGKALLSLTLFDHNLEVRYSGADLATVPQMAHEGPNQYRVNGNTALFDAVGTTVKGIEKWLSKHPDFGGQVKIVTLTDGQENTSKEWHINPGGVEDGDEKDLLGLIKWKQNEGWEFVFLGTGGANWLEQTFSPVVEHSHFYAQTATDHGHNHTYQSLNSAVLRSRAGGQSISSSLVADPENIHAHTFIPDPDPAKDAHPSSVSKGSKSS